MDSDNESVYSSNSDESFVNNEKITKKKQPKVNIDMYKGDELDEEEDIEEDEDADDDDIDDDADDDIEQNGGKDSDTEEEEDNKENDSDIDESVNDESDVEEEEDEEIENKKSKNVKNKSVRPKKPMNLPIDYDEDDDDDDDFDDENYLQKFDSEVTKNYIKEFHPECFIHNYEEISHLTKVVRNSDNIIIDPLHKTIPFLTKYERARILGQRAKQIESGSKPFVHVPENVVDSYIIAELELQQKRIPFIIRRPLPNGGCEYWSLKDLEMILF